MNFLVRLKRKWNITSNLRFVIICVVFAVTGSAAVALARPILSFLGIDKHVLSPWVYYPLRIMIIFPCYQFMLIIIGTLFGQFTFFWGFEKQMMRRMARR